MACYPITVGSFNPMQSSSLDRLTGIVPRTTNFDGIALVGTRSKATRGTLLRKRYVGNRVVIEAGWTGGELTNMHAGVSIMWGSRIKAEHLVRTECTPSLIWWARTSMSRSLW
eukprot:7975481-Pyramimonas_sp.AAC.1